MTTADVTTSGSASTEMHNMAETTYAGWPLIEINGVGPDGTCHCSEGANCKPGSRGKHPKRKDWQNSERVDVEQMLRRRPRANLGTLTGTPAGFWVLDIDDSGMDAMRELRNQHGPLPMTRVHQTGGGTFHYFFTMPDFEVTNSSKRLPKGIDVRGTGGQVVLPPSVSGKGEYRVVRDEPIVAAPDWLLDLLRPETSAPAVESFLEEGEQSDWFRDTPETRAMVEAEHKVLEAQERAAAEQTPREAKYERSIVAGEIARLAAMAKAKTDDESAYKGEPWDWTTFMVACQLIELANADWTRLTVDEARAIVMEHAPRDAGFDDSRVYAKVDSAIKKVGDKARPAPVDTTSWMDDIDDGEPADQPATPRERPTLHSMTDVGNARRLVDRRGDKIRWVADAGQWMAFDGKRWDGLGADTIVQSLCIETVEEAAEQESPFWSDVPDEFFANGQPKPTPRERFDGWCMKSLFEARLKSMANTARSDVRVAAAMNDFVGAPWLLNTGNCVVDLRDGSTLEHAPALMMNSLAAADYDPDAKAPLFTAFLERVQPDPVMRDYIQQVAGYSTTGETREQAFFLHYGSGANGKSVFLEIVRRVLGTMGQKVARDTLYSKGGQTGGVPSDIAAMVGARLLTASETAAGRKLDDERIKELVGGEAQRARHLYGSFFDFQPTGKIHLATNHLPPMESGGHGMGRRLRVIPWDVRIPEHEQDKGLEERIVETEAAGVLAWLVEGAKRWYAAGALATPQKVLDRTAVHIEDADPVWPFIHERLTADEDASTDFKSVVGAYTSWCDLNNTRPMSGPALSAALTERMGEDVRFKHPRTRASMFRVRLNLQAVGEGGFSKVPVNQSWVDEVS